MFALSASSAIVPVRLAVQQRQSRARSAAAFHVSAVKHSAKKGDAADIDYEKLVPGYMEMSRPQKYRARKQAKKQYNTFLNDQRQMGNVKNTSDAARKAFEMYEACVSACVDARCAEECKVDWGMA